MKAGWYIPQPYQIQHYVREDGATLCGIAPRDSARHYTTKTNSARCQLCQTYTGRLKSGRGLAKRVHM